MSRKKRYRRLRSKAVKDNFAAFEASRRKNREEREAIDATEQLGRARLMWEKFKEELASEARTPPQIIAAIEAFKDVIKKVVKHAHTRAVILNEVAWMQLQFVAAHGPKSQEQKAAWRAEEKRLRTSNRKPPEPPVNPVNN